MARAIPGLLMILVAGTAGGGGDAAEAEQPLVRVGLIADVQYADADPEPGLNRYYRQSLNKLRQAVETLNGEPLDFVVQLGDLIDRDLASFDAVLPIASQLQAPLRHVLGNHDFSVGPEQLDEAPRRLGLKHRYYDVSLRGWRFVVLDGNELSWYATAPGSAEREEAERLWERLRAAERPNAQRWNGGLSQRQLRWLDRTLGAAERAGQRAVVFCHFPVFPPDKHNLWNDQRVLEVLDGHRNVAAWIAGHKHSGGYGRRAGVHYVTLEGMVDTPAENAFAAAALFSDRIELRGWGRVPSRRLALNPKE